MNHRALVLAALTLALAAPVAAIYERLDLRVGGGAVVPAGAATDRFDTGWQLTGGVGWAFDQTLGLRIDYGYSDAQLEDNALSEGFVNGSHVVHSLEASVKWTLTPDGPAPIYLLGGLGLYRQVNAITKVSDYEPGPPICSPWLEVCAGGPVPADQILGSRTSTDPGLVLAAGVEVPIRGRVRFVMEVRWRLVRSDAYGLPGQATSRAWGSYFPLTLAVRF
jgi:hypothetical protein